MQETVRNGSDEEVSALLSSYIRDASSVAKTAITSGNDSSNLSEEDRHALDLVATAEDQLQHHGRALLEESGGEDLSLSSFDMSTDELLATLGLEDDGINDMKHYVDVLEGIERDTLSHDSKGRHRRTSKHTDDDSLPNNFQKGSSFVGPDEIFRGKAGGRRIKLPNLQVIKQLKAEIMSNGGRRRLESKDKPPQCQACESDDYQCNCRRLRDCSINMTMYDLSVMTLGGYVSHILYDIVYMLL